MFKFVSVSKWIFWDFVSGNWNFCASNVEKIPKNNQNDSCEHRRYSYYVKKVQNSKKYTKNTKY